MAKLIKVWDGSAWQTVGTASTVGVQGTTGTQGTTGAQGITGAQGTTGTATSSSITTWVKTAVGGETSLTGNSDSSTTLAYTPGQEQLFINGVLQVRGSDYTATNGTSITGLAALVAGDIATVTTVNAFSVTGAVPLSTVTANGDLIVGTSSGAVGRLGIGSTSQVLTVSGGVPTWATPSSGGSGRILQVQQATFGTQSSTTSTTYGDTGLTVTITPTASTSTILVLFFLPIAKQANVNSKLNWKLLRASTTLSNTQVNYLRNDTASLFQSSISYSYYDSPATTSATTYKVQYATNSAGNGVEICTDNSQAIIQVLEIGA